MITLTNARGHHLNHRGPEQKKVGEGQICYLSAKKTSGLPLDICAPGFQAFELGLNYISYHRH